MTTAAIASPVSNAPTVAALGAGADGRGTGEEVGGRVDVPPMVGRVLVGGVTLDGAPTGRGGAATLLGGEAAGAASVGPVGPPAAGSDGSLIVAPGFAGPGPPTAGFGGRLMRTVSFLGCTLEASGGLGGTAPGGGGGV